MHSSVRPCRICNILLKIPNCGRVVLLI
uniref:Uncharacterized protein n=1 Tax=Arundo donax TaxID=35708 RepID=A0A0A8YV73_ARUDO